MAEGGTGAEMSNWADRDKIPLTNVRIGPVPGGGIQLSGFDADGRERTYVKPPLRGLSKPVSDSRHKSIVEAHPSVEALRRLYRGEG